MELKNMAMKKQEATEMCQPCCPGEDKGPKYPYGLNIRLEEDSIAKLGLKEMPEAGSVMLVMAKANVDECSVRDTQEGKRRYICLQITDLSVAPGTPKKEAGEALYGDKA
jgi:hypothetical protein